MVKGRVLKCVGVRAGFGPCGYCFLCIFLGLPFSGPRRKLNDWDVIAYQQLYDTQSTAWSPLATQLRCYYRSVQLAKESFDGAQALL